MQRIRCAPKRYVIPLWAANKCRKYHEALTRQDAKGGGQDGWNEPMEGRGRLVTAADSQPSSMRVDKNRTSTGCHTPLMHDSLIFNRVPQVFITFTLCGPAMMSNSVTCHKATTITSHRQGDSIFSTWRIFRMLRSPRPIGQPMRLKTEIMRLILTPRCDAILI